MPLVLEKIDFSNNSNHLDQCVLFTIRDDIRRLVGEFFPNLRMMNPSILKTTSGIPFGPIWIFCCSIPEIFMREIMIPRLGMKILHKNTEVLKIVCIEITN